MPGTKLERFEHLARNPYWLNVTRFYCGCFSKGEVSALVDALIEMSNSETHKLTSHAQILALTLLGDWVFTQYQPAVRRTVELITGEEGFVRLISTFEPDRFGSWSTLPSRCGRNNFVEAMDKRLLAETRSDRRRTIALIIYLNSSVTELYEKWVRYKSSLTDEDWNSIGEHFDLYDDLSPSMLLDAIGEPTEVSLEAILRSNRFDVVEARAELKSAAVRRLLDGQPISSLGSGNNQDDRSEVGALFNAVNLYQPRFWIRKLVRGIHEPRVT